MEYYLICNGVMVEAFVFECGETKKEVIKLITRKWKLSEGSHIEDRTGKIIKVGRGD